MTSSTGGVEARGKRAERRKAAERALRGRIRGDFQAWCELVLREQGLAPARHHRRVIEELEGVAAGRFDRLMLLLPPGSAKSTFATLGVWVATPWAPGVAVYAGWCGINVFSILRLIRHHGG